ncbi:MAG: hypothetical protein HQL13_04310, partial [Candidatus Omnitrophica bacterium]|nr:hypothetical protein [Candidatus Omnitrophota bacterium]
MSLNYLKVFFIFFAFGILIYFNSLNSQFLLDDYFFLQHPVLSQAQYMGSQWRLDAIQGLGMDKHGALSYYRPLAHMFYDVLYPFFKSHFWQYHLLNLFLLVLAVSLIYLLLVKVSNPFLAFLAGLFYLVHPVNGIIVNYISAGVFALEVICILCAILFLCRALEIPGNRWAYGASVLFCVLSLFWHESGIMVPCYAAAFILLCQSGDYQKKTVYLSPLFFIAFFYFIFRFILYPTEGHLFGQGLFSFSSVGLHLAGLFQVFFWYLSRLFYPVGIVLQWSPAMPQANVWWNSLGAVLLVALFFMLWIKCRQDKIYRLGLAWFFIGFICACGAVFRRSAMGVYIEPHWFVFSSIGFFILVARFFDEMTGRMKSYGFILVLMVV